MSTRHPVRLLLLGALALLSLTEMATAKPCKRLCRDEIAACRAGCAGDHPAGKARRRCRVACGRDLIAACRQEPAPTCRGAASPNDPWMPGDPDVPGDDPSQPPSDPPCTDCGDGFAPEVHIVSSGTDRTYARFVPPDYDPSRAYPVVFAFHGDGGTGAGIRDAFGLEEHAGGAAIFVYPDATAASFRSFDLETPLAANADMQLVLDILTDLEGRYHVDRSRVFAAGFSRGAYFVNFLNCRLGSTVLRAIAAHSGSGPYGPNAEYTNEGHFMCDAPAAAVLMIHGSSDLVVPVEDGRYTLDQWTWANQCGRTWTLIEPDPCVRYDGCNAATPVEWCQIRPLAHAVWDQAGEAIWRFFAEFAAE